MLDCPHAPPCGGCSHLHLGEEASLAEKRERVVSSFARYESLESITVAPCIAGPSRTHHRTRVKLPVAIGSDGKIAIGLYAPKTHQVVDLPRCLVPHPALCRLLDSLRELLSGAVPPVTHIDARVSRATGEILVTLVADEGRRGKVSLETVAARIRERHPEVRGIGRRALHPGPTPRALAGRTTPLLGSLVIEEHLAGRRFQLSPEAFFQADPAAAENLHREIRRFLTPLAPMGTLVDLYAGVGVFGIGLADLARRVVAVESVPEAIENAKESAALNGIELETVALRADAFVDKLRGLSPDAIVVDPPRRGLDGRTISALGRSGAQRIAYASCDPETLSRDLTALLPFDWVLREAIPVDLFALSREVETVALLERVRGAFVPKILWRGADALAVEKPWLLPTTPQGDGPSLTSIVRGMCRDDSWSPAHRLDVGTSGPVLFARGKALGRLGEAFARGDVHKEYVALVRGVPRAKGSVSARAAEEFGGGEERTRFRRERVVGGYGLVRALPDTGKRHQIRRHLRKIGHPLLGDDRYGDPRANAWLLEKCGLNRLFLHLEHLRFEAPEGGPVELRSPLPEELSLVLERLERARAVNRSADADSHGGS